MRLALDQPLVVEFTGPDAGKILHNLTTNHIQLLAVGDAIESFVTDVRGWVVAHGLVYRVEENRWFVLGQHPDASAVVSHADRYIIREQVVVRDHSASASVHLCCPDDAHGEATTPELHHCPWRAFGQEAKLGFQLDGQSPPFVSPENAPSWQLMRIAHFWPRMGLDIWEKCIPQELDRNEQAISFTKGCYLGQETIARLDARGQIQKKLSLLKLDSNVSVGDKLLFNDAEVGHITSIAAIEGGALALAQIRRGYFAVDSRFTCQGFAAQVIDSSSAVKLLKP